jgi:glycosyltransferase involved in cell wall biosynthesis
VRIGYDTLVENPRRPSSAINFLQSLLGSLARMDEAELVVFVSRANASWFERFAGRSKQVRCLASNEHIPLRVLAQQVQLPYFVRRERLDVIIGLNQIPFAAGCATVVKTCGLHHHLFPEEYGHQGWNIRSITNPLRLVYRHRVWDQSARSADRVIANSDYTRNVIAERMRVDADRIDVVYESVDDAFKPALDVAAPRDHVKKTFAVGRPYVLYVSNLWFYKNPDGAIRAFGKLRASRPDVDLDLVVAGPDDYGRLPELRALAASLGVADRVHFLGRVRFADLIALYQAAHVIFYPSLHETYGKPVVEAMRSGVPLVAANATSLPEIVGDAGILVDPKNADDMADGLARAATDSALRRELIARGHTRAADFSWERVARETLAVCHRARGAVPCRSTR